MKMQDSWQKLHLIQFVSPTVQVAVEIAKLLHVSVDILYRFVIREVQLFYILRHYTPVDWFVWKLFEHQQAAEKYALTDFVHEELETSPG